MGIGRAIPESDLQLINDSFRQHNSPVETLGKNHSGGLIVAKRQIVNAQGYVINNFTGRVLRHQKSLIPIGGKQVIVGRRGDKYDDIPAHLRSEVSWSETDFEQ